MKTSTPVRFNPFALRQPVKTSGDTSNTSKLPSKAVITKKK